MQNYEAARSNMLKKPVQPIGTKRPREDNGPVEEEKKHENPEKRIRYNDDGNAQEEERIDIDYQLLQPFKIFSKQAVASQVA